MPTVTVETPEGKRITLEAPEGATQEQIFAFVQSQSSQQSVEQAESAASNDMSLEQASAVFGNQLGVNPVDMLNKIKGGVNAASFVATDIPARISAGIQSIPDVLSGEGIKGAETVKSAIKEIQPELSSEGVDFIGGIVDSLKGVSSIKGVDEIIKKSKSSADFIKKLGGMTGAAIADPISAAANIADKSTPLSQKATVGKNIGSALGEAIPQTAFEVAGIKGLTAPTVKGATSALKSQLKSAPSKKQVRKLLFEAAPSTGDLKSAARAIYNKIDDSGVVVNKNYTTKAFNKIITGIKKEGFNAKIHPKVSGVLDELSKARGETLSVSDIDTLRKVARGAARSIDGDEARLGSMIMEKIDDTLDVMKPSDMIAGQSKDIGEMYRQARGLWGRARRSEMIEEAVNKAKNQASGLENGIRVQFRSILNNKRKIKGFKADEIKAMETVVRGSSLENTAKAIGRFGFTEGQATSMLMGSAGVAGGATVGGPAGAVIIPLIGQTSKKLAQKLTRNNSELASAIIRAGDNHKDVIKAYFELVPKTQRSAADLTELFLGKNVPVLGRKLKGLTSDMNQMSRDAEYIRKTLTETEIKRALGLGVVSSQAKDNN